MKPKKTIVITGASRGLGKELTLLLSKQESNLILVARSKKLLHELCSQIIAATDQKPMILICDLTDETQVYDAVKQIGEKFQSVDVLINNAGVGIYNKIEALSSFEMRRQFEVNFFGLFYMTQALLPLLKASKTGYILNVSSLLSKSPLYATSVYSASKAALNVFSYALADELKITNIKVAVFLPGSLATSFQEGKNILSIPNFLVFDPKVAAYLLCKMIQKRSSKGYMYTWCLLFMKLKKLK
jgi:short-subunit dehydrogenase